MRQFIFIILIHMIVFAQIDMIGGYRPRILTRGKMWSAFRNNGLDGGGNRNSSSSHSQESLTYPGNIARELIDFVEYFGDVEAYINGDPHVIDPPRVTISQNSKGQGIWIMAVSNGTDTLVSCSGTRNITYDIEAKPYDINNALESTLGDSSWPNSQRSNYAPGYKTIIGNEPVEIHNYKYHDYILNDEFPEEIIISQWLTKSGIQGTRKAYAWSYPGYDDFIIQELFFKNTGSDILDPVYFALKTSISVNSAAHGWADGYEMGWSDWRVNRKQTQDDVFFYTQSDSFTPDLPEFKDQYIQHIMVYQRDGDWLGTNWDDTAQPYKLEAANTGENEFQGQKENQLLAYQYIGLGILDYLPSGEYVHPQDSHQPVSVKWWQSGNIDQFDYHDPNPLTHNDREMFDAIVNEDENNITNTPIINDLGENAMIFGPYRLEPGEKAKIVIAFVGGSGADWLGEDEITWSLSPESISEHTLGERSLFRNLEKAKFAYENGFDIPDAPPDVEIWFGNSPMGQVVVNWSNDAEDALDPDYEGDEAKDVRGYRIYRSWPPSHFWHNGPWEFVTEIPIGDPAYYDSTRGVYSFTDTSSFSGYNYYYSVHTYDSGHSYWYDKNGNDLGPIPPLESGMVSPEQKNMIAITPYQGSRTVFDQMSEPIRIVPNPYRLDFDDPFHMYPDAGDPYKIRFINLPRKCIIRVYTASGDLVLEKKHLKETSGESAWRQESITLSGNVVSGIYFWVVESLVKESIGQVQTGTLAIVK